MVLDESKNIRNFVIISHIDHGKSTLADRFLELTGTVEKKKMHPQYLDMMDLEREKGITIKLQPVRMIWRCPSLTYTSPPTQVGGEEGRGGECFILNLIDTPGHVDFSYEVSRSLAAVEGAFLLVDATQGVQAQTLANLNLAKEQGLVIIPVVNKIDLSTARIEETRREIKDMLGGTSEEEIFIVSAKTGQNVEKLLEAALKKIPPPSLDSELPLRALIFDSFYDSFKGAVAFVRIVDGQIKKGEQILAMASAAKAEALEVGVFAPQLLPRESLSAGEIGYIATGLKDVSLCRVGDTITRPIANRLPAPAAAGPAGEAGQSSIAKTKPLPGYREPKPMVFASLYPSIDADFDRLKDALSKLKLDDASLFFEVESSAALGRGFKCGFLGMLHLEIVVERLHREYQLNLVVTSPSVVYRVKEKNGLLKEICRAQDLPDRNLIELIEEPWVKLEVITPSKFLGSIMTLLDTTGGIYKNTSPLGGDRSLIEYQAPLREIIIKRAHQSGPFYDLLKSTSSGFASMNYDLLDWRPAELTKLDILVAGEKAEAFSKILPSAQVFQEGRAMVKKLKQIMPPQLFAVALQAAVGGKVIARETISAKRKDVTGYLYGGDYTRKRKLLEKQKRGKKKLKRLGRVAIPNEVFLKMLGGT